MQKKGDGRRGGGEVNVKGNAINSFVRSWWLNDGWTRINEQMKAGRSVREGCPFLNCLFRAYGGELRSLFSSSIHGQRLSLTRSLSHWCVWLETGGRHTASETDRDSRITYEHIMERETQKSCSQLILATDWETLCFKDIIGNGGGGAEGEMKTCNCCDCELKCCTYRTLWGQWNCL